MERRAAVSGALGSALEYFDFAVYGSLSALVFPKLFFSDLGSTASLLASLATFGVGFAARPAGAIVFGHLGDRIGRRPVLYASLLIMGAASVLIGLLPTGQGVVVAILLVALRFVQGFSLGGEATGNQLMMMEHSGTHRRGLLGSFVNVGSPLSQLLANVALVALTTSLTQDQLLAWGWRIPFLASLILVGVTVYIRLRLAETPVFLAEEKIEAAENSAGGKGLKVLLSQPKEILKLGLAWGGPAFSYYMIAVFGISYFTSTLGYTSSDSFAILMIANGFAVVLCILGGSLSDRIGRRRAVLIGLFGTIVGVALFFTVATTSRSFVVVVIATAITASSVQFLAGVQPALFAESFPTKTRFSGMALSLNFANLFFAAPAPFVAAALVSVGGVQVLMWFTLAVLVVSTIAAWSFTKRDQIDLVTFSMPASAPAHVTVSPAAGTE